MIRGEKLIIDVHHHYYPDVYVDFLSKREESPRIFQREGKRFISGHPPGSKIAMPFSEKFYDIEKKMKKASEVGIEKLAISLGNPWTDFFEPKESAQLTRKVNDAIAECVRKYPDKLFGLASVPLKDKENYLEELDRAILDLDLNGVIVGTNVDGVYLDSSDFRPFFKRAEELDIPIFLHPTTPAGYKSMEEYQLVHIVGFTSETSLVIGKLIFSGVLEEFPSLKIVAPHAGGGLPYLAGRFDIFYNADPRCRERAKKLPSQYLKGLYYDCIVYSPDALRCVYSLAGVNHLLFGTDEPFPLSVEGIKSNISSLNLSEEEEELIYAKNAEKLLTR